MLYVVRRYGTNPTLWFAAILLAVVLAGYTHIRHDIATASQAEYEESRARAQMLASRIEDRCKRVDDLVALMAGNPDVVAALQTGSERDLGLALSTLRRVHLTNELPMCFLLDTTGVCRVSIHADGPNTMVGTSYAFRPYAQAAMRGQVTHYFAKGITSHRRGVLAAGPVRDTEGKILGAAVIKATLDDLTSEYTPSCHSYFVDPHGVVFLSSDPSERLKSLWPIDPNTQQAIHQTRQFGTEPFTAILPQTPNDGGIVTVAGIGLTVARIPCDKDGWSVVTMHSTGRVAHARMGAMGEVGVIAAIVLAGYAVLIAFRRSATLIHQHNERLSHMVRVQKEIAGALLDSKQLGTLIAARLGELIGSRAAVGFLDGEWIELRAVSPGTESHRGLRLRTDASLIGRCVQRLQTLVCEDTDKDPHVDQGAAQRMGMRSCVLVPLQQDGHILGVLVAMAPVPHALTQAHVELVELMAGVSAAALGRAMEFEAKAMLLKEQTEATCLLRKVHEQLEVAERMAHLGSWRWDVQKGILRVSEEFCRISGHASAAFTGGLDSLVACFHPEDRELARAVIQGASQSQQAVCMTLRIQQPGGPLRYVQSRTQMVCDGTDGTQYTVGAVLDITEHHLAQEELHQSERRLAEVLEALPVGVWLLDGQGRVVTANPAVRKIWGGIDSLETSNYWRYKARWADTGMPVTPEEWSAVRARASRQAVLDDVLQIEAMDGVRRTINSSAIPMLASSGEVKGVIVVNEDITERRAAEQATRAHAVFVENLLNTIPNPVFYKDVAGVDGGCNWAMQELAGNGNEGTGVMRDGLPDELKLLYEADDMQLLRDGGRRQYEVSLKGPDGTVRNFLFSKATYAAPNGSVGGIVGVGVDITKQITAQQQLHEATLRAESTASQMTEKAELLHKVLANIPYFVFWKDRELRFSGCNERFARAAGMSDPSALIGKTDYDMPWGKTEADFYRKCDRQVMDSGEPMLNIEETQVGADGKVMRLVTSKVPLRDANGNVFGVVGMFDDVTEHWNRTQQLKTRLAAIDAADDVIVIANHEGVIEYVNPAFTKVSGYTCEEAIGTTTGFLNSTGQEAAFSREVWQTIVTGKVWRGRCVGQRKDGSSYPEEMTITPVLDDSGRMIRFVAIKRDITEQLHARELEQEKLSLRNAVVSMEQVLGVVGHELRTPLAALRLTTELLLDQGQQIQNAQQFMESLHDEVLRMIKTVEDLLEAARLNSGRARWSWGTVDVREVVDATVDTVARLLEGKAVMLQPTVMSGELTMSGDAEALRRVLVNLCSNAIKSTEQGSIQIMAREIQADGVTWVEIAVTDNGKGIDPAIQTRLGEAFALNWGVVGSRHVQGTGLGLAICKGVAGAHGGELVIASAVGQGTRVTVRLQKNLAEPTTGSGAIRFVPWDHTEPDAGAEMKLLT